jgi:hypothetical protein
MVHRGVHGLEGSVFPMPQGRPYAGLDHRRTKRSPLGRIFRKARIFRKFDPCPAHRRICCVTLIS